MLCVFDFIRGRLDYKSGFFLQINILEGRAGYVVLKGHISVTISLKYSMWAQRGKQM